MPLFLVAPGLAAESSAITDTVVFGDAVSETKHALVATHSELVSGGLGEPARILLPQADPAWEGGRLAFTLRVDPQKQNYATVRLWGSDATKNRLVLFCEGKQVGYRHLGDIDLLDIGGDGAEFPGRFIYKTTPLPPAMTHGKTELHLEIRSYGWTWDYGDTFDKFQRAMTVPARGLYKIYAHTDGCFIPPDGEKQGLVPPAPPVRQEPGAEVLSELKSYVNKNVNSVLNSKKPLDQKQMEFLARACFVTWTPAFHNSAVVTQVVSGLDDLFAAYRQAEAEHKTFNPDWIGVGMAGDAVRLLGGQLQPFLDGQIDNGGGKISRRAAFSEMFAVSRDWHRRHRRLYSNQTMINDLYGIYLCNRAVETIDPASALSESAARRYLYESVGLEPWRDSDPGGEAAPETGGRGWNVGTNYWELTSKGLTKELGFVGYYGEVVLDWAAKIYDATRPAAGLPGDEKLKSQLEKMAAAHAVFRYPGTDEDGFRAMRAETVVGWRDDGHYPGDVTYGERPGRDVSAIFAATITLDPNAIGHAQQMFEDGQFFIAMKQQMAQGNNLEVAAGLLDVPDQYELIKSQPPSAKSLPMTPGQPDFVFSDEDDGVVAVKNGDDILYASLYWRSQYAVNGLARIHFTTPRTDQIAVVQEEVQFEPSGEFYTRPDWTTFGFGNGGAKYPGNLHSAHAGEKLPVAKAPAGVKFQPGGENAYAGRADFYTLRYGSYLVGMNLTPDKTFELNPPAGVSSAKELVSGKTVKLEAALAVAPRSTVVLWLKN